MSPKPLLKWAGGKSRLAPLIDGAFAEPCRGTYYEPFAGSAAVFLFRRSIKRVRHAVLSDVNAKLVEVHRAIRDDVEAVLRELDLLPSDDWRPRYYEVRDRYNDGPWSGPAHAARFLWLNRAGYNGLYRENRQGRFNVPMGSYSRLSLPDRAHFLEISELLAGVELAVSPFADILALAGDGDQVYCDPPYVPLSHTACFTGYSSEPFAIAEQRALALAARGAAAAGARVVLSNHDMPVVRDELYPIAGGFDHVASPMVSRAISQKSSARNAVSEVIAAIGPLPARAA